MFKKIEELSPVELNGKKVFLRVDFNVPVENGKIKEIYRIQAHKDTIDFLVLAGAKIALVSHTTESFKDITKNIGEILGHDIAFEEDILNPTAIPQRAASGSAEPSTSQLNSPLTLFENIRKYEGEEKNDEKFALSLSKSFDIYINDAFSVSHREHASISAITKLLPSYGGFLLEKEIKNLSKVLIEPVKDKTVILGGVKVLTKLPVIKNFLDKAEHILVAGALANAIFKKKGLKIGQSAFEEVEEEIDWDNPMIVLPKDIAVSEDKSGKSAAEILSVQDINEKQLILDIGPQTIKEFSEIIKNSKTIIFNGPLGLAEVDAFSAGTRKILDSIIRSAAFSVIGGGDTLALVEKSGLIDKFGYVSTGGGAMLEFLAGKKLPGLEALGYYE